MAITYYTSTYIELLSTDTLPVPSTFGLRARYLDTGELFTYIDGVWENGWYDQLSHISKVHPARLLGVPSDITAFAGHAVVLNDDADGFSLAQIHEPADPAPDVFIDWNELIDIVNAGDAYVGDFFYISDQFNRKITVDYISPDGGCWFSEMSNSGRLIHNKIE